MFCMASEDWLLLQPAAKQLPLTSQHSALHLSTWPLSTTICSRLSIAQTALCTRRLQIRRLGELCLERSELYLSCFPPSTPAATLFWLLRPCFSFLSASFTSITDSVWSAGRGRFILPYNGAACVHGCCGSAQQVLVVETVTESVVLVIGLKFCYSQLGLVQCCCRNESGRLILPWRKR